MSIQKLFSDKYSDCLRKKVESIGCSVMSDCNTSRLFCPWNFAGKNIGVGCYFLLQGIFLTQGLNACLLHLTGRFFTTEPPGKPRENYLRIKPTWWTSEAINGERNEKKDEGMYRWKENEKNRYWTGRAILFYFKSQYITSLFSFLLTSQKRWKLN